MTKSATFCNQDKTTWREYFSNKEINQMYNGINTNEEDLNKSLGFYNNETELNIKDDKGEKDELIEIYGQSNININKTSVKKYRESRKINKHNKTVRPKTADSINKHQRMGNSYTDSSTNIDKLFGRKKRFVSNRKKLFKNMLNNTYYLRNSDNLYVRNYLDNMETAFKEYSSTVLELTKSSAYHNKFDLQKRLLSESNGYYNLNRSQHKKCIHNATSSVSASFPKHDETPIFKEIFNEKLNRTITRKRNNISKGNINSQKKKKKL